MTSKTYKRSELRDIMDKRDRAATKLGEAAARKYLRSKEQAESTGLIREAIAAIAFVILAASIIAIGLAL